MIFLLLLLVTIDLNSFCYFIFNRYLLWLQVKDGAGSTVLSPMEQLSKQYHFAVRNPQAGWGLCWCYPDLWWEKCESAQSSIVCLQSVLQRIIQGLEAHLTPSTITLLCFIHFTYLILLSFVFQNNPCKHPIIILKDVQWFHLCALVEFMYAGVVNVAQTELPTFLQTAESLHILGLTDAPRLHKDGKIIKVTRSWAIDSIWITFFQ